MGAGVAGAYRLQAVGGQGGAQVRIVPYGRKGSTHPRFVRGEEEVLALPKQVLAVAPRR